MPACPQPSPPPHQCPHPHPSPIIYTSLFSQTIKTPIQSQESQKPTSTQMGICSSADATSVATAKLIMPDGRLQEYSQPIKAHYVLQRLKNPSFFICNSDEMDFNDVVSPLNDDDELHLGQLYFVLPLNLLKYPLKAADMAELAVRASNALMKSCGSNGGGGEIKWLSNVESCGDGRKLERRRSQSVDLGGGERTRRGVEVGGSGRRRRRTHSTDLGVILE